MGTGNFDRLLSVLYGEEPDRVPLFELYVNAETMQALTGSPIARIDLGKEGHRKAFLRLLLKFFTKFGYDYLPIDVPTNAIKGVRTQEAIDRSRYTTGVRIFMDENRGIVETHEDFERYTWLDPNEAFSYELLEDTCRMLPKGMGLICGIGSGGIMEIAVQLMSLRGLSISLYKDRELVKKVCDKAGELCVTFYEYVSGLDEVGALSMGDDMGYKSGTMISPEHLRKYMLPWHKKCVEAAHKHGKTFILHSCGDLTKIMEDLIEYVGIDAKHSFQDAIEPAADAKRKYGDKIAVLGGADVDKLSRSPTNDLRRYIKDLIRNCALGGGYALGSGNSLPNYVRPENYMEMVKLGRSSGKYPIS